MTTTELHNTMKLLAKLIYLSQMPAEQTLSYRKASNALGDQLLEGTGTATEFSLVDDVQLPIHNAVKTLTSALNGIPGLAKAAADRYLQQIIGPQLGTAANANPQLIVDALAQALTDDNQTVQAGGIIATYISSTYDRQLPTAAAGSETIRDDWVTNEVV
jgi:hypothetical protein